MTWVTWVTWAFVALAVGVVVVAALVSRGSVEATLEPPYEPVLEPSGPSATTTGQRVQVQSGIGWSEPAAWRSNLDEDAETEPQPYPLTTGEPADGRHEAQDR